MTQDLGGSTPESNETSENNSILSSSAVMAAGTIVSRLSGFVRGTLLAAALGAYLHADLFNIANTVPNMLYILLAGGIFNAVLVPQLVRAMKNDADGGEAYTNRIITLAGLFLAGVTAVMVLTAPWLMRVFLVQRLLLPRHGRPTRVGDRLRPLLPAAGVLLRHVRAGRAGAQRPRQVRTDDVGADREQRDLGGSPRRVPGRVRPREGLGALRRVHHRPGGPARGRLHARHRRAVPGAPAVPEGGRLQVPPPVRLPRLGPRAHPAARCVDGAVRDREPDRLHRRRTPCLERCRLRADRRGPRHRLHDLLADVPAGDGAARDRHRLPGHRGAAADCRGTPPTTTWPRSPAGCPRPCVRRSR